MIKLLTNFIDIEKNISDFIKFEVVYRYYPQLCYFIFDMSDFSFYPPKNMPHSSFLEKVIYSDNFKFLLSDKIFKYKLKQFCLFYPHNICKIKGLKQPYIISIDNFLKLFLSFKINNLIL